MASYQQLRALPRDHASCAGRLSSIMNLSSASPLSPPLSKVASMDKLTTSQRKFLELAVRSPTGNPWPLIGARQRGGGSKSRMFDAMKAKGWFDGSNCITPAGRQALEAS
jgi:hypothetical protein